MIKTTAISVLYFVAVCVSVDICSTIVCSFGSEIFHLCITTSRMLATSS